MQLCLPFHTQKKKVVFAIFLYHYIRSYITWDEQSGAVQHNTRQDETRREQHEGPGGYVRWKWNCSVIHPLYSMGF